MPKTEEMPKTGRMPKTEKMEAVENRFEEYLESLIPRLYEELGSFTAVAQHLDIPRGTLVTWCWRLGIRWKRSLTSV